jgi:hypothetical protein
MFMSRIYCQITLGSILANQTCQFDSRQQDVTLSLQKMMSSNISIQNPSLLVKLSRSVCKRAANFMDRSHR